MCYMQKVIRRLVRLLYRIKKPYGLFTNAKEILLIVYNGYF